MGYSSRGRSRNSIHMRYGSSTSRGKSRNSICIGYGSRGMSGNSIRRRYSSRGGRQSGTGGAPRWSNRNTFILQNLENSVIFSKKRIK
jgi:hypothetical protein